MPKCLSHLILTKFESGNIGSKTRSLGQIFEKTSIHSRGHSFGPNFMKLCQNVGRHQILFYCNLHEILSEYIYQLNLGHDQN